MEMKELKIRQLKFNDIYAAAKIVKHIEIDITEDQLEAIKAGKIKEGVKILQNMVADSGKAKNEINDFLGGLFGISGDEFGELGVKETMDCMTQLKDLEGVGDFLSAVEKWIL